MRARDLGLFATGSAGPANSIVDVPGVAVGHRTLVRGEGALVVGKGPVRTGVTIVLPRQEPLSTHPVFAGLHRLNGNGEMTGSHWIEESGLLTSPVALTNTHSVGVVRDALVEVERSQRSGSDWWSLPVVAETWDGVLNDINGAHVAPDDVKAALETADTGPVSEGNVGSGTGMICHGFKGGIGTSSRTIESAGKSYTLGVLVQANHGARDRLVLDGFPIGRHLDESEVSLPGVVPPGAGSIVSVIATDAPLVPHQCRSLAARSALGIGRAGGVGECWSGDLSIAFSTGNSGIRTACPSPSERSGTDLVMADQLTLTALYAAAVDATEESIANALFAAETMTGRDGNTAHELPLERLEELLSANRSAS